MINEELEENRKFIYVHFENHGKYTVKVAKVLARKIKPDGNEGELGPWEVIYLGEGINSGATDGVNVFEEYVEFGFSFDIQWGEDWPYSGCFWTANDGIIENGIRISVGGESRDSTLHIYVDSEIVVDECNSAHEELIG